MIRVINVPTALIRLLCSGMDRSFLRSVPCGNSHQMGCAINDSVQRLMASKQGTERKSTGLSPMEMCHNRDGVLRNEQM